MALGDLRFRSGSPRKARSSRLTISACVQVIVCGPKRISTTLLPFTNCGIRRAVAEIGRTRSSAVNDESGDIESPEILEKVLAPGCYAIECALGRSADGVTPTELNHLLAG